MSQDKNQEAVLASFCLCMSLSKSHHLSEPSFSVCRMRVSRVKTFTKHLLCAGYFHGQTNNISALTGLTL